MCEPLFDAPFPANDDVSPQAALAHMLWRYRRDMAVELEERLRAFVLTYSHVLTVGDVKRLTKGDKI